MLKFLITSDYHISETSLEKDYTFKNFKLIEDTSKKFKPDYYINTGDFQKGLKPFLTPLESKILAEHIFKINAKKKVGIVGNHDKINEDLSKIDWLSLGLDLYSDSHTIVTKNHKLYLAHRTVDEAQLSNNWHLNSISYKIITKQTKADIIILGHVHRPQIIHKRNPLVLMPGSIARNNFTEGTEFKYIWLLTLDGKKIKLEKIKTFTRTHLDIIYDLSNKRLFVNDVECQKLDKETIKDSVTKITLRGTRELIDKVDIDKLYKKFIKVRKLEPIKYDYTDALNTRNLKVNNCKNNKNNTKELFKDYAKKTKLSKPVTKFIEKIIT